MPKTLHLGTVDGTLQYDAFRSPSSVRYEAGKGHDKAVFEHLFDKQTDIVGGAALKLWIAAKDAEDAGLFVGLRKLDIDSNLVQSPFSNKLVKGPVALGWLRASHRELDPAKSTRDRPWHPHTAEQPLVPGKPTIVEIEIWPSATRFEAGERLQLIVQGSNLYTMVKPSRHLQTRNKGVYVISTGGDFDSQLVINEVDNYMSNSPSLGGS